MISRSKFVQILGKPVAGLVVVVALCLSLVMLPGSAAAQQNPDPTATPGHFTKSAGPTQLPSPTVYGTPTPTPIKTDFTTPGKTPANTQPVPPTAKPTATITPTPGPKLVTTPPTIRGTSAIVVDSDTGRILYAKEPHLSRAQASTTKIVTALTFLKLYPTLQSLQATTTIVQDDLVGEANMALRVGENIRVYTLLMGLLTNSANEAGMALARFAGQRLPGSGDPVAKFVAAMNAYAASIGMRDSHFMNPHGLDQPGHYSSAYDLALSGWYALRNPILMQLAQVKVASVDGHDFYNVDSFLFRYPGATGLKPGWTDDAGRVLVATARNNGRNVMVVVMNSTIEIAKDVDPLMDYGFTVLNGQASTPLAALNFGSLAVAGSPQPVVATPKPSPTPPQVVAPTPVITQGPIATPTPVPTNTISPIQQAANVQALTAQMQTQLRFTLQLAATFSGK